MLPAALGFLPAASARLPWISAATLPGLNEAAAVRLYLDGTPTNLAVVGDRQNTFMMVVDGSGAEETRAGFYVKGPFGQLEAGTTGAQSLESHAGLGFTGAGAPNASGGYVYLRNRWYDPQTGRFLSQDPIGLAGGVNLYAYAGNNPIAYSDPFGLTACDPPDKPCDNPEADGSKPWYEFSAWSRVNGLATAIDEVASETGVDARLIRSVMYVETTHGWYDAAASVFDMDPSIRPMNINSGVWGAALGVSRTELRDPTTNIRAGAEILARISAELGSDATVAQIATRYNNGSARFVSDYGARVAQVYSDQPWQAQARPQICRGFC